MLAKYGILLINKQFYERPINHSLFEGLLLLSIPCVAQKSFTPEWSKVIVWYQIFLERFNNGDPTNDPKDEDQDGAYPFNTTVPFQTHPGRATGTSCNPTNSKMEKIFTITYSVGATAAICRES
jgi:hypothetical protein